MVNFGIQYVVRSNKLDVQINLKNIKMGAENKEKTQVFFLAQCNLSRVKTQTCKKYWTIYKETHNFKDRYQTHPGYSLMWEWDRG